MSEKTGGVGRLAILVPIVFLALMLDANAQVQLWIHDGDNTIDSFGNSMTIVSDSNGDGVRDVLVGEPGSNCSAFASGHVHMLSGSDGAYLVGICGTASNEGFSFSVKEIADVDLDGIRDLMVGSPYHDDLKVGSEAGAAYVYSGATQNLIYQLIGEDQYVHFGDACASIADVDGDGLDDLLVSAPSYAIAAPTGAGRAYVYSSKTGALLRMYTGAHDYDNFGLVVARVGDVNADGLDDYAIYAPLPSFDNSRGKTYVFSASDGNEIFHVKGDHDWAALGRAIADAGDLDGDGYADVLLGAPGGTKSGYLYAYSGKTATVMFTLRGDRSNDLFGTSVARVGDMNGDGSDEILVGASADKHDGHGAGVAILFSGKTLRPLYRFYPGYDQAVFGDSVVGGVDFNHDNIPDVAVSALVGPPDSSGNYGPGRVTAFAGNDLFLQASNPAPKPNDVVNLTVAGGGTGQLALIAVVDIDGAPSWTTVLCSTIDANGELVDSESVPSGASGHDFTLVGYAVPSSGKGLIDTGLEVVSVQ